jgi:hypothetical protein
MVQFRADPIGAPDQLLMRSTLPATSIAFPTRGGSVSTATLGAGGARISEALTPAAADRRFIRAVSIDLTGRSPLDAELVASFGRPRSQFVRELSRSLVAWEGFYEEELFYFLLVDNFRPSTDGFLAMPRMLAEGSLSVREALRQVVSSQFFNARNPGNDTFVTVVLEQLIGITVQKEVATLEAGKKMYDGYSTHFLQEKGSTQADLVRIAVDDERFEPFLLERRFTQVFGEAPPRKNLAEDAARLRQDPLAWPEIVSSWLCSQAYEDVLETARPKSDRAFIRSLFADLLGRPPEYQEIRRCRKALLALSDSRPLRSVLIKMMLDSGLGDEHIVVTDPAEYVRAKFLHFLAREPTEGETGAFVRELKGGASPRLVLRALLTHAEYQAY